MLCVSLAIAAPVQGGGGSHGPRTETRLTHVFTIDHSLVLPAGSRPEDIGADTGGECGLCIFGFLFRASDGSFYAYEYSRRHLKHFVLGESGKHLVEIIPGPTALPGAEWVYDGAVSAGGSIALVSDHLDLQHRFRTYVYSSATRGWTQGPTLDPADVGLTVPGVGAPSPAHELRIDNARPSEVAVFPAYDMTAPGVVILADDRETREPKRSWASPGARSADGGSFLFRGGRIVHQPTGRESPALPVEMPFGIDAAGNAYFIVHRPGPPSFIECYGFNGTLTARTEIPHHRAVMSLVGKGSRFVTGEGRFAWFLVTEKGLEVEQWRREPAR